MLLQPTVEVAEVMATDVAVVEPLEVVVTEAVVVTKKII